MAPVAVFFRWAPAPELQAAVAHQPFVVQFVEIQEDYWAQLTLPFRWPSPSAAQQPARAS